MVVYLYHCQDFPNKVTESDNRLGEIAVLLSVSGIVEVSLANAGHGEIA